MKFKRSNSNSLKHKNSKFSNKVFKRRIRNFVNKHKRPFLVTAATVLTTAGIVGGSLGTLAWQNYQENNEIKGALNKAIYVIGVESGVMPIVDNWEIGMKDKYTLEILKDDIISRNKLGIDGINKNNPLVQEVLVSEYTRSLE